MNTLNSRWDIHRIWGRIRRIWGRIRRMHPYIVRIWGRMHHSYWDTLHRMLCMLDMVHRCKAWQDPGIHIWDTRKCPGWYSGSPSKCPAWSSWIRISHWNHTIWHRSIFRRCKRMPLHPKYRRFLRKDSILSQDWKVPNLHHKPLFQYMRPEALLSYIFSYNSLHHVPAWIFVIEFKGACFWGISNLEVEADSQKD